MITTFVTCLLFAVIAGIFFKNAIHALLLVVFVLGVFVLSCYACRIWPRARCCRTARTGLGTSTVHIGASCASTCEPAGYRHAAT